MSLIWSPPPEDPNRPYRPIYRTARREEWALPRWAPAVKLGLDILALLAVGAAVWIVYRLVLGAWKP